MATKSPRRDSASSLVSEDEKRLLKSLREIKDLFDLFNLWLSARFNIKSILTLVVENTFSEMRTGASDMPLQLEFDYRFSRSIKERLKRQCLTPYSYFTSPSSYYPRTYLCLCKLFRPSKIASSKEKQANCTTSSRNEELESYSRTECFPKNCTKYDHPRQSRNSRYQSIAQNSQSEAVIKKIPVGVGVSVLSFLSRDHTK